MPKVGMPEIRRPQLIKATIKVIGMVGMSQASVSTIGRTAGVSPSIINHYFGGKAGLLEATMRYLLKDLAVVKQERINETSFNDPLGRILAIVDTNFQGIQSSANVASTWLAFWSSAIHDPALYRLQQVNEKRLLSYVRFELMKMLPRDEALLVSTGVAALIDGLWLRGILTPKGADPLLARKIISDYVATKVPKRFSTIHNNSIKGNIH